MVEKNYVDDLKNAVANLDTESPPRICEEALALGTAPAKLVEAMSKGMDIVGVKYESEEYFLSDLIMAGEAMKSAMKVIEPHLKKDATENIGKVVIGTVHGDIHDIGKNIVVMLLIAAGFDVIDLGVDASADRFVQALREHKPDILAMSALLTVALPEMENVIREVEDSQLRKDVKLIVIGGTTLTEDFAKKIRADAYGATAVAGVRLCREIVNLNAESSKHA